MLAFAFYVCCSGHIGVTLALVDDQVVTGFLEADASRGSALAVVVTLGEAEEALEEAVLLLLLLAGGLLGVGGRGLLVELGALGGDTTHAGTKASLETGDDDGDHGILGSAGKNVLESLSDSLSDHLGEHVDDSLEKIDLSTQDLDIASSRADVTVQGIEMGTESANLAADGIDMLANGIDMRLVGGSNGLLGAGERLLSSGNGLLSIGDAVQVVDIDTKRASSIEKSMLDHAKDLFQDSLGVKLGDTMSTSGSLLLDSVADLSENGRHLDTTSVEVLLDSAVLNGMVNSMLDKAVKVGLAMKTVDHVLNAGADVASLSALTTETITLSDLAGELNKELSGRAHAVPLRAGGITTSLAETKEASVVIEGDLDIITRSVGLGELSVGTGLGKLTSHTLNDSGVVGTAVDNDRDGGLGRGHVTSTVTLGGGSGRAVSHGAISDRGLDVNARVNREGRGLGRLLLGGGLGVDRKLGLSRSHCFGLVVDV